MILTTSKNYHTDKKRNYTNKLEFKVLLLIRLKNIFQCEEKLITTIICFIILFVYSLYL